MVRSTPVALIDFKINSLGGRDILKTTQPKQKNYINFVQPFTSKFILQSREILRHTKMKTVSISLSVLLSTLSMTGVAHAQSFDGPSVGVQAGWIENKVRDPKTGLGVVSADTSKDSAVFGGYAAYDKEFGKFVLGAEIGANFGTSDTVSSSTGANRVMLDSKRSFDFTTRAGYLVTPKTLLYGRAGYTNDRVNTTIVSPTLTGSASEDRDGWLVGGGVERMVTDHVSARLEYRYADLSNGDRLYSRRQVLTGITFRF